MAQHDPTMSSSRREIVRAAIANEQLRQQIISKYRQSSVFESGMAAFSQILQSPTFRKSMADKLKHAHSQSIAQLATERRVPDALKGSEIRFLEFEKTRLVLGDCCAFVVSNNGDYQQVNVDLANMAALYFPVSKNQTIVATRPGRTPPLDTADAINLGSVACSRECFFSSTADLSLEVNQRIGENANPYNHDYIDEIVSGFDWDEGFRKSLSPKK